MGAWKPFPLPDGSYSDETRPWSQQDVVNYLPTKAELPGARSGTKYVPVPGLQLLASVGKGPHRGARDVEGRAFVVAGQTLYRVSPDSSYVEIGTIPGTARVSMTHNQVDGGNQLLIGTRDNSYLYDTTTDTLAATGIALQSVDFLNQRFLGIDSQRRFWRYSDLADGSSGAWNTLNNESAESSPDRIVGGIVAAGYWWAFGERTIEVFANDPNGNTTFSRAVVIEKGCANAETIKRLDSSVFFLGNDSIVYRMQGYQPVPVSPKALTTAFRACDPAKALAYTYEDNGYLVYYLTFQDGRTWGYDVTNQRWHRRESFGLDRWRVNTLFKWNGDWYAGDYSSGNLYLVAWGNVYEGCEIMPRSIRSGVMHNGGNRMRVHGMKVLANTGLPENEGCTLCGTPATSSGGASVPSQSTFNVGIASGDMLFQFATGSVPDRAEVWLDGEMKLDTGWWGDPAQQANLNAACAANGIDTGIIQPIPNLSETAYQQWDNGNAVSFTVSKEKPNPLAVVKVYAPISGTAWKFQLGCPGAIISGPDISGDAPSGSIGAAYSFTYTVTGGTGPYTFSISSGTLPDGLSLDASTGEISGTPTTSETQFFTVRVVDANNLFDSIDSTINIDTVQLPDEILADGPILYWKLNETSGTTAVDYSGNGYDGTYQGSYSQSSSGVTFPTVNGGVFRANTPALEVGSTNTWTIEAIFTRNGKGGSVRERVAGQWILPVYGYESCCVDARASSSKTRGAFSAGSDTEAVKGTILPDGARTHLMVTREPTAMRIYENGVETGVITLGSTSTADNGSSGFAVGGVTQSGYYPSSYGVVGKVEHVAVYGTTLSAARVLAHAQAAGLA